MAENQNPHLRELGGLADKLTAELTRAEDVIREQGFGVRALVKLQVEGNDKMWLAFGKQSTAGGAQRWGLFLINEDTEDHSALGSASLVVRIAAARQIPELVEELRKERTLAMLDIGRVTQELCTYLDTLEGIER